jgi:hypothetical protein
LSISAAAPLTEDEDDDELCAQRQCIACRVLSPRTRTAHTLISAQFGWRLSRTPLAGGGFSFEWRCPPCWVKFRDRNLRSRAPSR